MQNQKILVLGGKGKTGRKIVQSLTQLGHTVRIGSRSESPSFDWNDQNTWVGALEGMQSVYITYQPDLAVPAALATIKSFVQVAVKNGIKKMVLLSGRGEKEVRPEV